MAADPLIPTLDPAIVLTLRSSLALLLLVAAAHKLSNMAAFRSAAAGYEIVPRAAVRPFAVLVVLAELILASALVIPDTGAPAALGAGALLAVYTMAIGVNLVRGRRNIDCGCLGPAGARPLGPGLIVRNTILLGVALAAALPVAPRPLLWLDLLTVAAAAAALNLLFVASAAALANESRQDGHSPSGLRRRMASTGESLS